MKWLIYFVGIAIFILLKNAQIPPFHLDGSFLCTIILLMSVLNLSRRPTFNTPPKGSWVGYLKGIAIFLPLNIFFTIWFDLSIAKSISYIIVALLVSIVLRRPQDDSWKSANYWAELPFVGFAVMYLVDQGIIQYFWS